MSPSSCSDGSRSLSSSQPSSSHSKALKALDVFPVVLSKLVVTVIFPAGLDRRSGELLDNRAVLFRKLLANGFFSFRWIVVASASAREYRSALLFLSQLESCCSSGQLGKRLGDGRWVGLILLHLACPLWQGDLRSCFVLGELLSRDWALQGSAPLKYPSGREGLCHVTKGLWASQCPASPSS